MKRERILYAVVAIASSALLVSTPLLLSAAGFQSGDQVTVAAGVTTTDDLYLAGGTVSVNADVRGDLYAGGGTILINSNIGQDLGVGGGTITILGNIGDDVRAGGGTITIQGSVGGDVLAGGGSITLSGNNISGDVLAGGGTIRIDTPVGGKVRIGGKDVYLNSSIVGDVEIDSDKLTLGSKAVIGGDLTYRSANQATIESGAVTRGKVNYEPRLAKAQAGKAIAAGIFSLFKLGEFLMLLAGALVFGLFFKRYLSDMVKHAYEKPLLEFGRGAAVIILMPIASIFLLVTVVGVPLGILGLLSFAAILIFVWLATPVLLGSFLYRWIGKSKDLEITWLTILLGTVVSFILGLIPIVGWLAESVICLMTLGAAVHMKWDIAKSWR
jgi:hypothetical protein